MKKVLLSLCVICAAHFSSVSQVRVSLVMGGHQSSVVEENDQPGWAETKSFYKERTGVHLGFQADMPLAAGSKVYFQPGVVYYNKGRQFQQTYNPPAGSVTSRKSHQYINYVDIPMNLLLKMGKKSKFIIGGGPYAGLFFNGQEKEQVFTQNGISRNDENKDLPVGKGAGQYRVLNYGIGALAGFESGRLFVTANYHRGLNDFYQAVQYNGSFRHQVMGATVGIYIGKPVEMTAKVRDRDGDGIPDKDDRCPDEPGSSLTNGCPDRDGDGIPDKEDRCPDQGGSSLNGGCPLSDRDGDGVYDHEDLCPDVAGSKKYKGCPIPDTDGDGVNDEEDLCPTQAGHPKYKGCPIPDTDGDGINDEEDKCPLEKGSLKRNGCPEIEVSKEIVERVNSVARRIQFGHGSAELLPASRKILEEVAVLLLNEPGLQLLVEGHTSNDGILDANMALSENRANSVKEYLVSKGISASRISAIGYGPTRPLNDGKHPAQKALNRRVELKLSN